ncbi:RlpA-like double-psi beta-barrel-protein domain-containing protein-containing protein, partial [Lobosporangium transversale]
SVTASTNGLFSGRATWFTDKTGSCGKPFDTNDMIVAMNAAQMDGTSQCGRQVRITAKGQSVVATVVDTCPSRYCSSGSLDLSQAVFKKLAPLDVGVIQISWSFV